MADARRNDLLVKTADFGLTAREIDLVRSHAAVLDGRVAAITDEYYAHLAGTEYARLMPSDRVDQLKASRISHWRLLLKADFRAIQADYIDNFGPRLLEHGFPQSIFVVAADWFAVEVSRVIERCTDIPKTLKAELRLALLKVAFYDLALAQAAREVAYLD